MGGAPAASAATAAPYLWRAEEVALQLLQQPTVDSCLHMLLRWQGLFEAERLEASFRKVGGWVGGGG